MVPAIEEMGSYLTQQSRCIVFSAREATNRWETERLQEKATFALNRRAYHVFVFSWWRKGVRAFLEEGTCRLVMMTMVMAGACWHSQCAWIAVKGSARLECGACREAYWGMRLEGEVGQDSTINRCQQRPLKEEGTRSVWAQWAAAGTVVNRL